MIKQPPSIFNDVIGPVMRGPSSSHTAASVRIGKLVRQFLNNAPVSFHADFAKNGSLATTYSSQGSDIGLAGGLLNMQTSDHALTGALDQARNNGISVTFAVTDHEDEHPNTYRIRAVGENGEDYCFIFISTGGGMIELRSINEIMVAINGDFHETLLFYTNTENNRLLEICKTLAQRFTEFDYCSVAGDVNRSLINIKSAFRIELSSLEPFLTAKKPEKIVQLDPVLPVKSRRNCTVPFTNATEILAEAEKEKRALWELAVEYESARGNLSADKVLSMAVDLVKIMKEAVNTGLRGTVYSDRILGPQASGLDVYKGLLIGGDQVKRLITYITAIMETKSAMGVIVAAPTAGSCAGLPGTLLAAAEELGLSETDTAKGLLAAGLVGVLIVTASTFAAEECGCQAECGAGSGMAAAGLVQLAGGSAAQALDAAAMGLQNIIGMVCDPVANRVEVPCLGKNVLAGMNAIASANMALAGFDCVIPLDETIAAFDQAGRMLPPELRCTGYGGLSIAPTSLTIHKSLLSKSKL
jgi:L-serine dehydratase